MCLFELMIRRVELEKEHRKHNNIHVYSKGTIDVPLCTMQRRPQEEKMNKLEIDPKYDHNQGRTSAQITRRNK